MRFPVCCIKFLLSWYNTPIKQVPLIRLYGSTPVGQKTLLHVHGVFPYVYVPFEKDFKKQFVPESADGDEGPDSAYSKSLNLLLVRIANSIDKALNISMGRGEWVTVRKELM